MTLHSVDVWTKKFLITRLLYKILKRVKLLFIQETHTRFIVTHTAIFYKLLYAFEYQLYLKNVNIQKNILSSLIQA